MDNGQPPPPPPDLTLHKATKEQMTLIHLRENLRLVQETMPVMLEYHIVSAKLRRSKYNALIEAGFAKDEALTLCMGENLT